MSKLVGIGVGTGDPEELTLKGLRMIKESDVILVPISGKGRTSRALTAIEGHLAERQEVKELLFPMTTNKEILLKAWNVAITIILDYLKEGKVLSFITIGDVSIYSTFTYIRQDILKEGYPVELIPGIPSFCSIAAKAGKSLCDWEEPLLIYPSNYNTEKIKKYLHEFDNIVLMKAAKEYEQIVDLLEKEKRVSNSYMISKCGYDDEEICMDLRKKQGEPVNYLSTIIVKKGG